MAPPVEMLHTSHAMVSLGCAAGQTGLWTLILVFTMDFAGLVVKGVFYGEDHVQIQLGCQRNVYISV